MVLYYSQLTVLNSEFILFWVFNLIFFRMLHFTFPLFCHSSYVLLGVLFPLWGMGLGLRLSNIHTELSALPFCLSSPPENRVCNVHES